MALKLNTTTPIEYIQIGDDTAYLLDRVIALYDEYRHIFETKKHASYAEWVENRINEIRGITPWYFVVMKEGQITGAIWACDWETLNGELFSCKIGGMAHRKTDTTTQAIKDICDSVFRSTTVEVIRVEIEKGNKAPVLAARRAGFSHPEARRAIFLKGDKLVDGVVLSLTRREYGENREKEEESI